LKLSPIGIDYTPAYEQGGGIGRYVRELVAALAAYDCETDYRLFVAGVGRNGTPGRAGTLPPAPGPNFRWKGSRFSAEWFARIWHRARIPIPVERWTGQVALFHATDFVLPPTRPATRTVLTVHDLSFVRAPETASPSLRRYLERVVPRSVRSADHVLADSQATKDDLIALYGTAPEKVTVLLSGVNPRFKPVRDPAAIAAVRARYGIGASPFVLAVGTVQPRKNYERLMQALSALADKQANLVIAGGRGWLQGPIYQAIDRLEMRDRVRFIGFAGDADLPALYSAARCVAFPSLYEGFGLPILEAMACGTPVVTSNVSSLVEVADEAALLVDPLSVDQIAAALDSLLHDDALCARLVKQGLERARLFTWERAAAQLHALYARLLT
jgi:glycosyltransferase involved in cell wall biosynthesis